MIKELSDKRVFINHGPTQMALDVYVEDERMPEIGVKTAEHVVSQLSELAQYYPQLKSMRTFTKINDEYPEVLNKMITAVEKSGYEELNTLGAVAGSFSDIALEKALELGATRVIVNNGGDIAFKDLTGKPLNVGIPLSDTPNNGQLILNITSEMNVHGICTSGIGGRSFTKGIATAAVALAKDAATADACATYLANMTNVEDENIGRCLAEEIDTGTDIAGQLVTLKVGEISRKAKYTALLNGLSVAEDLYNKGIIKGAIICIDNDIVKYPDALNVILK